jgi:hypothetical protein
MNRPTASSTPGKRYLWGAAVAGVLAIPAALFGLRQGYEHAAYSVSERYDAFELRRYQPRVVAEVAVDAKSSRDATRAGFRILADYIFGGNADERRIAMTVPVDVEPPSRAVGYRAWTVRFTMPSEHRLGDLPAPQDDRIRLRTLPSTEVAALRFRGAADAEAFEAKRQQLRLAVRAAGLSVRDETPTYAQYDPPWTPGLMRRNEVMLEVTK